MNADGVAIKCKHLRQHPHRNLIYRATHDNILRIKSEQTIRFGKALSSIAHETVSIKLSFR